jgi:gamma-butyrobetaine dioxygenase
MTTRRWEWDERRGPTRLVAELADSGLSWIRAPALLETVERDPWEAAARILGARPDLVERQPIRAVPGGRSFSSSAAAAPFHSDSQTFLGVPPHVQVMACHTPALSGGESLYLDSWPLVARIEAEAPDLLARLFDEPRRFPFVFGDFHGPTLSLRGGSLVFTHTAFPEEGDGLASALRPFLESAPVISVRAEAGDLLVAHNHRLLHGRRAFEGTRRFFTRLLVWRRESFEGPEAWRARAAHKAPSQAAPVLEARDRLRAVLELLRGVPAGVLSKREAVPEARLYAWRDAALEAALEALSRSTHRHER